MTFDGFRHSWYVCHEQDLSLKMFEMLVFDWSCAKIFCLCTQSSLQNEFCDNFTYWHSIFFFYFMKLVNVVSSELNTIIIISINWTIQRINVKQKNSFSLLCAKLLCKNLYRGYTESHFFISWFRLKLI